MAKELLFIQIIHMKKECGTKEKELKQNSKMKVINKKKSSCHFDK